MATRSIAPLVALRLSREQYQTIFWKLRYEVDVLLDRMGATPENDPPPHPIGQAVGDDMFDHLIAFIEDRVETPGYDEIVAYLDQNIAVIRGGRDEL